MRGKAISGMMLTLLLIGMSTLAFNIQPVKASGTIYIRADGSVEPDTAPISTVDNVTYTFTDNIHESIVVERDNIVVDGAGYPLTWSTIPRSGTGIALSDRSNVTIKNVEIYTMIYCAIYLIRSSNNNISGNNIEYNNEYGILLDDSSNNSILGNNIANNDRGFYLNFSSNNSISGNNITNNRGGIYLYSSSNNTISRNNIMANDYSGITLWGCSNNTLRNNDANNNKYNFGVYGSELSHYTHDIDDSNTVDGKPVYYWFNRQDMAVPLDLGWIALINCTRMTAKNLNLTNNGQGILLAFTTNSTITKNRVSINANGVYLYHSSNNSISGNIITNNSRGVCLSSSSFNSVSGNNITNNVDGIELYMSSYNSISGNNITNDVDGIYLNESSTNSIASNSIANNGEIGIYLDYHSNNNTITRNNITNNGDKSAPVGAGICEVATAGNNFHHNNFIDNWQQVFLMGSTSTWDDGYPSGGNYWSDYAGVDAKSGPYQNETGSDGIGDTSYIIDKDKRDRYPLMKPYVPLLVDLNDDGRVDIRDIATAALAFGSYPSNPRWNSIADINKDNKVDIRDIATIAKSFGK